MMPSFFHASSAKQLDLSNQITFSHSDTIGFPDIHLKSTNIIIMFIFFILLIYLIIKNFG
ncbi:hypothetical protein BCT46_03975 [Vibrio sp. 10N.261.46.E8]|nr:hypothetical protein BCU27_05480 [Vibrio sp. 10N.286.45.B6]PMM90058.1 hypothetical protein BCT46_03975 [Vibrio sp. 10N.261.46.E8]PMN87197.1 hypothetical protein BCT22_05735 [Vibrio sp. 10N.261.45.A1]